MITKLSNVLIYSVATAIVLGSFVTPIALLLSIPQSSGNSFETVRKTI